MSNGGEEGHYDDTPGARMEDAPAQNIQTRDAYFSGLLEKWSGEIVAMLPKGLSKDKFFNSAIAAVRNNPEIVECTPRSIYTALIHSAQDGLLPDGKDGVITAYKNKAGKKEAKWNPMTQGLRKRARDLDHMIIDAQVVHENDNFVWRQGDDPGIDHNPAKLGTDRGPMIGAYAIFKREDGAILHREVMDRTQIMAVKEQSKQQTSLMWTKFETEGWRKTVIRRGIKTVPVSENLMAIVSRDDDNFTFDQPKETAATPALVPPKAKPPTGALENKPAVVLDAAVTKEPVPVEVVQNSSAEPESMALSDEAYPAFLQDSYDEVNGCETEEAVEELRERVLPDLRPDDVQPWKDRCAERSGEIFGSR